MEPRDYVTIAGVLASIAAAFFGIWRARRESQKAVAAAAVAAAVEHAVREERLKSMEKRIGELEAELNGVRAGLESGLARVHDSLGDVAKTLQELKTTVAVLVDRDERPHHQRAPARASRKAPA